jgi:hypothetical protein
MMLPSVMAMHCLTEGAQQTLAQTQGFPGVLQDPGPPSLPSTGAPITAAVAGRMQTGFRGQGVHF